MQEDKDSLQQHVNFDNTYKSVTTTIDIMRISIRDLSSKFVHHLPNLQPAPLSPYASCGGIRNVRLPPACQIATIYKTIYQLNRTSFCTSSKINDHVWMSTNKRLASIGGMHSISPPRALIQSMYKHTHQPKGILISKQRNIHGFS